MNKFPLVSMFPEIVKPEFSAFDLISSSLENAANGLLNIWVVPLFLTFPEISIEPLLLSNWTKPLAFAILPEITVPFLP